MIVLKWLICHLFKCKKKCAAKFILCGAKDERKGLIDAIEFARKGDTLVVWKLDRSGRSLKHLIETVDRLHEKGVGFASLQESIDTTTPGKLIFHVFGALAEFDVFEFTP